MKPQLDLRIVELLCSRLCHDLVGPIGAVNNGIELLEDFNPDMAADVLPLLTSSAKQAWRRLDFFRVAIGFGGGRGGWSIADLRGFASGLIEGGKATLEWPSDPGADTREIDATVGKLLLNLFLIASEGLPRGGEIHVAVIPLPPSWRIAVVASGPMTLLHDQVQETLLGKLGPDEIEARTVQAYFTTKLAEALGGRLVIERQPNRLTLGYQPPA